MNSIKGYLLNIFYLFLSHVLPRLLGLIASVMLVRYLGKTLLGEFSLIYSYLIFFHIIVNFGVDAIVIRELSKKKKDAPLLIGNAILLRIILGIINIFLCWFISWILHYPSHLRFLIRLASLELLLRAGGIYSLIFYSEFKAKIITIVRVFVQLVDSLGTLFLIFVKAQLIDFVILGIISSLVQFWLYRRFCYYFLKPTYKLDTDIIKFLLWQSWPLAFTSFMIMIYKRIDQIMIFKMLGSESLGIYSAAVKLSEYFDIIVISFTGTVLPLLSRFYDRDLEKYKFIWTRSIKYLLFIIVPASLISMFYSERIITLIYGRKYILSSQIFPLLMWAEVFIFIDALNRDIMTVELKQKLDILFTAPPAILNFILNLLLIPSLGLIGATFATFISYSSILFIGILLPQRREFMIFCSSYLLKISLCFSVALYIGFKYKNIWMASTILILTIFLTKLVDSQDIKILKSLFKKDESLYN